MAVLPESIVNASLLALNAAVANGPVAAGATAVGGPKAGPESDQSEAGFADMLEQAVDEQLLPGMTTAAPNAENAAEIESEQTIETEPDSEWEAALIHLPANTPLAPITPEIDEAAAPVSATALAISIGLAVAPAGATSFGEQEALRAGQEASLPGQEESLALPLAGKRLPAGPSALSDLLGKTAAEPSVDAEPATATMGDAGWSSMLDAALASVAAPARSDQQLAALRLRPDSMLNHSEVTTLVGPATAATSGESVEVGKALDSVPGIALRSPHFATLLGNQVLWQARVGNQQAEIRLDPPELGPIEVRISQKDSETHLHFVVGHQATREQLEQAMPRLRELFGQGGLQLGQVAVEQGQRETASGRDQQPSSSASGSDSNSNRRDDSVATPSRLLSTSLIDDYA